MTFEESIDDYVREIKEILLLAAKTKGYHGDETDGRLMYDNIILLAGEGHASGEIIYKIARYRRTKDPKDIAKIGAWAFLIWDKHQRDTQPK